MSTSENQNFNPDIRPSSGDPPVSSPLTFKRAFWVIAGSIAAMQVVELIIWAANGFPLVAYNHTYTLQSQLVAVILYLLFTVLVLWDMKAGGESIAARLNLRFELLLDQIGSISLYFAGAGAAVLLMTIWTEIPEQPLDKMRGANIALSFILTVVMAPICEEIIFRGYLYGTMFKKFKRERERLVINAMLFAAAHVFLLMFLFGAGVPYYIFVLGYLLALLYERSRSILPCIMLHVLNNLLVFIIDIMKVEGLLPIKF